MTDLLACVDCLGPATIQVVSPEGVPIATLCQEDFDAHQKFGQAIRAMLDDACKRLTEEAEAGMLGDLSAFKPRGFSDAVAQDAG